MVPTGATDARTAKVIQLYATPNPVGANTVDVSPGTGRNLAERRHPSQLTGHPNTDRFGMPPASVTPITDEITLADGLGAEHGNDVRSSPLFSFGGIRGAIADTLTSTAGFIRERMTGDYDVDEFGFDPPPAIGACSHYLAGRRPFLAFPIFRVRFWPSLLAGRG